MSDVQVFARFRPKNKKEEKKSSIYSIRDGNTIDVADHSYTFDRVFGEDSTQEQVYQSVAFPLVQQVLDGFNCTVMAYGQTGSGKSYTMFGNSENIGIIPRIGCDLFRAVSDRAEQYQSTIECSYVEIYMEKVRDLLNPELDNLKLREMTSKKTDDSFVYIEGCTVCSVGTMEDMLKVMHRGDQVRSVAATNMNKHSSRSHSVFVVTLTQVHTEKQTRRISKLFLVDLAGSEQVDKSGVSGLTLEQAKTINKSLSTLSLVIQSLVERKKGAHIPYRDSKLTRLLTDSLGGNSKTVLLLALSPAEGSVHETVSTLGFGARAKKMVNNATVNEEMTVGTYKTMVNTITKDLNIWKLKHEELESRHNELLAKYNILDQAHNELYKTFYSLEKSYQDLTEAKARTEQELKQLKETYDSDAEKQIQEWKVKMGLELEKQELVEKQELEKQSREYTPPQSTETCIYRTGNLIVFGMDSMFNHQSLNPMFTFEQF